jgi:DNA-binding transcriptional regulator YiaG
VSTKNVDSDARSSCQQKMLLKMSPAQCRAARALLGITQTELAETAGLGLSTVVDFEKQRRIVSGEAIQEMKLALEKRGILFLETNGEGEGVRLRRRGAGRK